MTVFIDKLVKIFYQNEYVERLKQHEEELKEITNSENEIPIFVCTLALPYAPCPLHIYEPRYRLMIRRAIESGKNQFGMCMYTESTPYHTEYGCVLDIQSHQFTRDGRAIVATVGGRRFKVLSSTTKDGYSVGQIEWVKDERVEDGEERAQLQLLHDEVYRLAHNWYSLIPDAKKDRILEIYGFRDLPEPEQDIQSNDNGPYWFWFLLNILPLETHLQYKFLTKTNLKDRLKQMKKIIIILMTPLERLRQMNESSASHTASSSSSSSLSASRNQSVTSVSPASANIEQQQPSAYNISPSTTESSINQYVQNIQENLTTSSNSSDQQQQQQQQQQETQNTNNDSSNNNII